MRNKNIIAILGGMGPEASNKLYQLIIEKSRQIYHAKNNDDYPEILIDSIPVPDFISDVKQKGVAEKMLIARVKQLSGLPIKMFCIACNTAHVLLPALQKEIKIPFVSIIDEIGKAVKQSKINTIGLLGSPVLIRSNLYQKSLKKIGVKTLIPNEKDIEKLGQIAKNIVAGKYDNATNQTVQISDYLKSCGAEGIILGCTELPLVFPKKYSLPIFDSLEILANALLKKYFVGINHYISNAKNELY